MKDSLIGTFVKLIKPEFTKTFGQGNPPEGLKISTSNQNYFIPWDSVLKLSETCDGKNKIADLESRPYPLLHINFYNDYKESFQIITERKN